MSCVCFFSFAFSFDVHSRGSLGRKPVDVFVQMGFVRSAASGRDPYAAPDCFTRGVSSTLDSIVDLVGESFSIRCLGFGGGPGSVYRPLALSPLRPPWTHLGIWSPAAEPHASIRSSPSDVAACVPVARFTPPLPVCHHSPFRKETPEWAQVVMRWLVITARNFPPSADRQRRLP